MWRIAADAARHVSRHASRHASLSASAYAASAYLFGFGFCGCGLCGFDKLAMTLLKECFFPRTPPAPGVLDPQ